MLGRNFGLPYLGALAPEIRKPVPPMATGRWFCGLSGGLVLYDGKCTARSRPDSLLDRGRLNFHSNHCSTLKRGQSGLLWLANTLI